MKAQTENWKTITIENNIYSHYQISNLGNIKNTKTGRTLNPGIAAKAYKYVELCSKTKSRKYYIHRLVATTFNGYDLTSELVVDHKDENKLNNNANNLQELSRGDNSRKHFKYIKKFSLRD